MRCWNRVLLLLAFVVAPSLGPLAQAQEEAPGQNEGQDPNAGQADLDRATEAKLTADSPDDLEEVIRLARSALKAGLDESNTEFAESLLMGTLMQRAEMASRAIFDRPSPPPQWPQLRKIALNDLESVLELNDQQAQVHYMIGRLQALPGGDRPRALEALNKAVELAEKDSLARARALVIRANLHENAEQRLADYEEAVKLAPKNTEILRSRGLFYLTQNKLDEAVADFNTAIEIDPKHADTYEARGLAQLLQQNFEEALESFDRAIELQPKSASAYMNRARVHVLRKDTEKALADLGRALELQPDAPAALLMRARVHQQAGNAEQAMQDVEKALEKRPGLIEGLQLHAALSAGAGKFEQAIEDLEQLRTAAPQNPELLAQLGMLYIAAKKPEKAVESFSQALEHDANSWVAYRGRADARLSLGEQAEAISDYEAALKLQPKDSGILNNLAWVLATSTDDKLRDGKRALELATLASEVTNYQQAHILSTLAAAYAETGDFEKAIEWSKKAVELGGDGLGGQLKKELQSYQEGKPWREAQTPVDLLAEPIEEAPSPAKEESAESSADDASGEADSEETGSGSADDNSKSEDSEAGK